MPGTKAATSRSSTYERVETEDLEKGSSQALQPAATPCVVCWPTTARVTSLVFYTPLFAIPFTARMLSISRHYDELTGKLEGLAFGALQDVAIFLQALLVVRVALVSRQSLLSSTWMSTTVRHDPPLESWSSWLLSMEGIVSTTAHLFTGGMLAMAFLWATLPCLIDLALQIQYLPRLNRGFMSMFLKYSEQFSSSVTETLTPAAVFTVVMYVAWLVLWVVLLLLDAVPLPRFESTTFCGTRDHSARSPGSDRLTSLMVRSFASSVTVRTAMLSLMAFVFALHASVGLDGDGNDIRWLSNAMFQLQAENALRPPTATRAVLSVLDTPSKSIDGVDPAPPASNSTTASLHMASSWSVNASTNTTVQQISVSDPHAALHPVVRRLLSEQEDFETPQEPAKHPFWRKTKGYHGPKRFDIRYNSSYSASTQPPDIILINMESFRSLDVGVIGARAKKAATNQTVTPFFDELSESGVLFRQHYTPCVQTSRTLLTSLFGTMPSLTEWSALATYDETKLRVHGLPQILKEKLQYENVFWSAVNLGWENWAAFLRAHGFDKLVDENDAIKYLPDQRRSELDEDDSFSWGRHDKVSLEALEHFLEQRQKQGQETRRPLFLDVYTISSHDPWVLPKSFTPSTNYSTFITEDNEKYLHALNYVDQAIAQLVTNLAAARDCCATRCYCSRVTTATAAWSTTTRPSSRPTSTTRARTSRCYWSPMTCCRRSSVAWSWTRSRRRRICRRRSRTCWGYETLCSTAWGSR
ncbi:hypothetical protein PINS_up010588 [Pythium insidiosum]|nr:hypothetical protein PINS_up010588 [Pythium insidiosum]